MPTTNLKLKFKSPKDRIESIGEEPQNVTTMTLPNGRVYDYKHTGTWAPSITTCIDFFFGSPFKEWRAIVGDEIADDVSHRATVLGEILHDYAEKFLKNPEKELPKDDVSGYKLFMQLKPFFDENNVQVLATERVVFHSFVEHQPVAGRYDCLAIVNNIPSIIDFKTAKDKRTKKECIKYFTQIAFYAAALKKVNPQHGHVLMATHGSNVGQFFSETDLDKYKELAAAIINHFYVRNGLEKIIGKST